MEIPRHWRLKAQRYRLEGSVCPTCGQLMFPPRPICAQHHSTSEPTRIARGELLVVATSISLPDIESQIRYRIPERITK